MYFVYCERKIYDGGGGTESIRNSVVFACHFQMNYKLQEEMVLDVSTQMSLGNLILYRGLLRRLYCHCPFLLNWIMK